MAQQQATTTECNNGIKRHKVSYRVNNMTRGIFLKDRRRFLSGSISVVGWKKIERVVKKDIGHKFVGCLLGSLREKEEEEEFLRFQKGGPKPK